MVAIMHRGRRPRKRAGHMPVNYYVTDRGRRYRVCATTYGRVLMVMLKHVHVEQALEPGKRRYREIAAIAARENKVELKYDT
jgi:hypothetical protein